ncbi:GHMP family kinase ATP-binding protein [Actinokineospora iranica]|uniref:Galactokinase n=1 Tax=Actinokineospora iranica TaxID=1271860 RepID=A0A1G6W282_9PSEU|nr:hypothetical protein [Actinokineospora iranica]SDD59155.1 galactokinase [Actinokineospora iranica]
MDQPRSFTVSCPVRACLSGEDLDWVGGRSVCVALDLYTTVEVNPPTSTGGQAPHEWTTGVWSFLGRHVGGLPLGPPPVAVSSAAPSASGLSSSSALILALFEALATAVPSSRPIPRDTLVQWAYEYEFGFCDGGGMDQLAIALGGATLFAGRSTGLPDVLDHTDFPQEWAVVVVDSRTAKSTPDHIRSVRTQHRACDPVLAEYAHRTDAASDLAWQAIRTRDLSLLGTAMTAAHRAMRDLQRMSTPLLERLRAIARRISGLPMKVSGAGGGGALVGICPLENADTLARELRAAYRDDHPGVRVIVAGSVPSNS